MKRFNHILLIALGVVLLSSCSKEPITGGNEPLPEGAVTIAIALPKATASSRAIAEGRERENYIGNLKIFIFDALTGELDKVFSFDASQDYVGEYIWDYSKQTLSMREFSDPERVRTVYVIANWEISDPDLAAITNVTELEASQTEMKDQIIYPDETHPLLMSGKVASWDLSKAKALTVKLKHQMIKFTLYVTIDPKFRNAFPNHTFICSDYEVCNAPKLSYVCEQPAPALPLGNTMLCYKPQKMYESENSSDGWHAGGYIYVYENPATGVNAPTATYFILHLPYTDENGVTTDKNYYKITIKNGYDVANPHRTVRNTRYYLRVRVEGFGSENANGESVAITTSVEPWDAEDVTSSDGDLLEVNSTSVHLKQAIANRELVVTSSDPEHTTVTAAGGKVDVAYDKATGVVTLNKAAYDSTINKPILAYETIIIKTGSLTKTVTIDYEPVIWATGDIALDYPTTPQNFVFGTPGDPTIVLFTFNSRIAITQGSWGQAMMMWKNGDFISREGATTMDALRERSAEFPGDPCAYVTYHNKDEKWRTPTKEEFEALNNPLGKEGQRYGMRGYLFSGMKDAEGNDVFLNSSFHMRLPDTSDGLRGYYWSSTPATMPDGSAGGWDFIADEYFQSGVLFAPTRINREGVLFQFPVRCVRDFR